MRKRIFGYIFLSCVASIVLTGTLVAWALYGGLENEAKLGLIEQGVAVAHAMESGDKAVEDIGRRSKNRITLVDSDGTVLYDSYADASSLKNHAQRPEIAQALASGEGQSARSSETLDERIYYYALRLKDGRVLRLARTSNSVLGELADALPLLIVSLLASLAVAALLSKVLSSAIILPIKRINLENPLENDAYEEIVPLLIAVNKQQCRIDEQYRELISRRREFDSIIDRMDEGLIVFGTNGLVLSANRSALDFFSVSAIADNMSYPMLCRNPDYINAVESALSGISRSYKTEHADRIFLSIASPVVENDGVYSAVLYISDITEKERGEALRREFSANVSHELKTPLTTIMGAAEIIEKGIAKQEDTPRFAAQIYSEATRLHALIVDIIKLSQLDESEIESGFTSVELRDICELALEQLSSRATEKHVKITLEADSSRVRGIEPVLYELVYNLLDNAVSYNRKDGSVYMKVAHDGSSVVLTVSDNGIGIPAENQNRVFERFYRVDKSRSKDTGGTGLGLSIVKHAAVLHNAIISLKSEPEQGTTVTVRFSATN
ncbi:MAG: ATP-binding protein [Oscillospiraceae bacterium]